MNICCQVSTSQAVLVEKGAVFIKKGWFVTSILLGCLGGTGGRCWVAMRFAFCIGVVQWFLGGTHISASDLDREMGRIARQVVSLLDRSERVVNIGSIQEALRIEKKSGALIAERLASALVGVGVEVDERPTAAQLTGQISLVQSGLEGQGGENTTHVRIQFIFVQRGLERVMVANVRDPADVAKFISAASDGFWLGAGKSSIRRSQSAVPGTEKPLVMAFRFNSDIAKRSNLLEFERFVSLALPSSFAEWVLKSRSIRGAFHHDDHVEAFKLLMGLPLDGISEDEYQAMVASFDLCLQIEFNSQDEMQGILEPVKSSSIAVNHKGITFFRAADTIRDIYFAADAKGSLPVVVITTKIADFIKIDDSGLSMPAIPEPLAVSFTAEATEDEIFSLIIDSSAVPKAVSGLSAHKNFDKFSSIIQQMGLVSIRLSTTGASGHLETRFDCESETIARELHGSLFAKSIVAGLESPQLGEELRGLLMGFFNLLSINPPKKLGDLISLILQSSNISQELNLVMMANDLDRNYFGRVIEEFRVEDEIAKLRVALFAVLNYENTFRTLPFIADADGAGSELSWRVKVLPFMEHSELYYRFNLSEPWNGAHNRELIDQMPNFFGKGTNSSIRWVESSVEKFSDIYDGTRYTVAMIAGAAPATWTENKPISIDEAIELFDSLETNQDLIVGMYDGSVCRVPAESNISLFRSMLTPRGDENNTKFVDSIRVYDPPRP
jgi:hypothetical protein